VNFDVEIRTNASANVTKIKTLHAINMCTHHVIFKNNRNMSKIVHIHCSDLLQCDLEITCSVNNEWRIDRKFILSCYVTWKLVAEIVYTLHFRNVNKPQIRIRRLGNLNIRRMVKLFEIRQRSNSNFVTSLAFSSTCQQTMMHDWQKFISFSTKIITVVLQPQHNTHSHTINWIYNSIVK